ncbi:hypothetical protein DUP91_28810, partial [Salmonella enterica subsp. enterica]|nr:hypothetical protein [Salmonella enterica subsp. enterica]
QSDIDFHAKTARELMLSLFFWMGIARSILHARNLVDPVSLLMAQIADQATMPRCVYDRVMKLLVPLEAIARRLIITLALGVLAPGLAAKKRPEWKAPVALEPAPAGSSGNPANPSEPIGQPSTDDPPASPPPFALLDPQRRYGPLFMAEGEEREPFWRDNPNLPALSPLDDFPERPMLLRIASLAQALSDMPAQAQRFIRWMERRTKDRRCRALILRTWDPPGRPPRSLAQRQHLRVHHVLADSNAMAWWQIAHPEPP